MNQTLPESLKSLRPFLWSYDIAALDLEKHKKRIITSVLNWGTKEATDWLFAAYSREDIKDAVRHPLPGEWDKKSLSYWSLVLEVKPAETARRFG